LKEKTLKKIYEFLEWDVLEQYEYPCSNCGYFECEKNTLNAGDIIKKKYKWNDIDFKHCLKRKKQEYNELMKILRMSEFIKWSHEECKICNKKFFKHDMRIHTEISEETSKQGAYPAEIFHLCKKCHRNYKRRKTPIHKGYRKF
jgi:hypothetical protein